LPDGPSWRQLLEEATARLGDRNEARCIVEEASGRDGAELGLHLDVHAPALPFSRYRRMVDRRAAGEPLQYVVARWGFRSLDVHVDARALIPRPETEVVVEHALRVIDEVSAKTVVDLGTGSGVIALSLAVERVGLSVWATDASAGPLALATANLAGVGRAAARVRLVEGDWFAALPDDLRGAVGVVVSNPPYVAAGDPLPSEVVDWEPVEALIAGPSGLEAIERIVADAPAWLARPGALVLEIGETQGDAASELVLAAGFSSAEVHPDLAGRPRVLVGRLEAS
jgi:release factor glutamine methyltransferase